MGDPPLTRNLLVRNLGSEDLTTANLAIPAPFQIGEGLSPLIAPGSSDTFSLKYEFTTPGVIRSAAQFDNNDEDENPFNFELRGIIPPTNDLFDHAIEIAEIAGQAAGTNLGAAREIGEPNHAGMSGGASVSLVC